jgi:hypothetical protein
MTRTNIRRSGSTGLPSQEEWLSRARTALEELGAEPVIAGALAALLYRSTRRETTDIDFLIRRVDGVRQALEALGLEAEELALPGEQPHLYFFVGEGVKIDVMVAETEYQTEAMRRSVDGFLSREDVIIHKLIAWRARDRDDIKSIIESGWQLDADYIEHWAREWDVLGRWEESRAESG